MRPSSLAPRWTIALAAVAFALLPAAPAMAQGGADPDAAFGQQLYTADEIDNLLGPIALYPDALLAQVLIASTFPDQIEEAAEFVRRFGTDGIDDQGWDVSVKAVAHYPPTLNMMAEEIDWTATLGRAYASQSSDVMGSVQRLRSLADLQGNLVSNEQQQVVREDNSYVIVPAQPQVIYVPTYDPYFVYRQPFFRTGFHSPFWSFGVGFPIGSWLIYDFNWGRRSIFYHGWDRSFFAFGGGWRGRAFPFIQVNNFYVNRRFGNVYANRGVWRRPVNVFNLNNRRSVHRGTRFAARGRDFNGQGTTGRGGTVAGRNGQRGGTVGNGRNGGPASAQDQARRNTRFQGATIAASTAATRAERQERASTAIGRVNADRSASVQRSSVNRQPFAGTRAAASVSRESVTRQSAATPSSARSSVNRQSTARQVTPRTSPSRQSTARQAPARQSTARPAPARAPSRASARPSAPQRASPQRVSPQRASPQRASAPARSTPRASAPARSAPKAVSRQPAARQPAARSSAPRSSSSGKVQRRPEA